jgi:hypothetical protein
MIMMSLHRKLRKHAHATSLQIAVFADRNSPGRQRPLFFISNFSSAMSAMKQTPETNYDDVRIVDGVVYALVRDFSFQGDGEGESIESLYANQASAAREAHAHFDDSNFRYHYDEWVQSMKGPLTSREPLHNVGGKIFLRGGNMRHCYRDEFVCRVLEREGGSEVDDESASTGDPLYVYAFNGESEDKLAVVEENIKGPLAFYFDDTIDIADVIAAHTGIAHVHAELVARYAMPNVYLFHHTIPTDEDRRSYASVYYNEPRRQTVSSTVYAAAGDAAPSHAAAVTLIRDAINASSSFRERFPNSDVLAICPAIFRASKEPICRILDQSVFYATQAANGSLIRVSFKVDMCDESTDVDDEFFFICKAADEIRYNHHIYA